MIKIRCFAHIVALCLLPCSAAISADENNIKDTDYLQLELARQIDLAQQVSELATLMQTLSSYPPGVIDNLMNHDKATTERLKGAIAALQSTTPEEETETAIPSSYQIVQVPRLTAKNIVYAQAQTGIVGGMVIFEYEGETYSATPGKGFSIRGKEYRVVSIKYLTSKSMEVAVRTRTGVTKLVYPL